MGIFKRLKGIALADINSVIDKMEDPISMLNQYLRDLEVEIEKAEKSLANQLFIEKKYKCILTETEGIVSKRARQAQLAVEKNEDEIAKLALQDKITNEKKLATTKEAYETTKKQTTTLYGQVKKLKETYEELQRKKLILISRANAAQASNQVNQTLASFSPENAVRGFARMEDQILNLEAKASAAQSIYEMKRPQEAIYLDKILQEEVQLEFDKLKRTQPETV